MATLVELTSVFEGIASMRIAQTKNQVLESTKFFDALWKIYLQLRVDAIFSFGRETSDVAVLEKELFIIITAEGGFSGDIDQKLVESMIKDYNKVENDIIVIGRHGAMQLSQRGIEFRKYYKLPSKDQNINVAPIIKEVQEYRKCTVYYQQYISLMDQEVKKIGLTTAIQTTGAKAESLTKLLAKRTTFLSHQLMPSQLTSSDL
jgi:F0F1-type ATP synthase gamma subunit